MATAAYCYVCDVETLTDDSGNTVYSYPWRTDPGRWKLARRLIVEQVHHAPQARGSASMRMTTPTVRHPGATAAVTHAPVRHGAWCAIAEGVPNPTLDPTAAVWWGYLDEVALKVISGAGDGPGSVMARGMGYLLDRTHVTGWRWAHGDDAYGLPVNQPPTANLDGRDGEIVGNAFLLTDDGLSPSDNQRHVFARSTQLAGQSLFTRWRLLQHLCTYCVGDANGQADPGGQALGATDLPNIAIDIAAAVQALLDDEDRAEVYDLRLTFGQLLDVLVPAAYGLGWDVVGELADGALRWRLDVRPTVLVSPDTTDHPDAKATAQDLTAGVDGDFLRFDLAAAVEQQIDRVVVRGRIVIAFTVSPIDYNLQRGWSDDQQVTYAEGAGSSASNAAHEARREEPDLVDVGRRFVVQSSSGYDIRTQVEPITGSGDLSTGTGYSDVVIPAIPLVDYRRTGTPAGDYRQARTPSGSLYTYGGSGGLWLSNDTSRCPYLPAAVIESQMLWPRGVGLDGTDQRSPSNSAAPNYLPPRMWYYSDAEEWTDLLDADRETPRWSAEPLGLACTVEYRAHNYLLKGLSINGSSLDAILDWQRLALSIGVESEQPLQVVRTRHESVTVRRQLIVDRDDLSLWIVRGGCIIGLEVDGSGNLVPKRASYDTVVRDDFPRAERLADQIAVHAFQPQNRCVIELPTGSDLPSWAALFAAIGTVTDGAAVVDVRTCIMSIKRIYSGQPRYVIETLTPSIPAALLEG